MSSSRENITYNRQLKCRYSCDVLVAGGGPSGVAAAASAARAGRSVRLIETSGCLGGLGTSGLVPAFMQFSDGINFLASGIGREVHDRLRRAGGLVPADGRGIRAEVLKRVYDEILIDAKVDFTFHTSLVDVEADGGTVRHAVCADQGGMFAIEAKLFVDGTGNGDLSVYAGYSQTEFRQSRSFDDVRQGYYRDPFEDTFFETNLFSDDEIFKTGDIEGFRGEYFDDGFFDDETVSRFYEFFNEKREAFEEERSRLREGFDSFRQERSDRFNKLFGD